MNSKLKTCETESSAHGGFDNSGVYRQTLVLGLCLQVGIMRAPPKPVRRGPEPSVLPQRLSTGRRLLAPGRDFRRDIFFSRFSRSTCLGGHTVSGARIALSFINMNTNVTRAASS